MLQQAPSSCFWAVPCQMSRARPRRGNQIASDRSSSFVAPWRFQVGRAPSQHSKITRRCASPQQHESVTCTRLSGSRSLAEQRSARRRLVVAGLWAVTACRSRRRLVETLLTSGARARTERERKQANTRQKRTTPLMQRGRRCVYQAAVGNLH